MHHYKAMSKVAVQISVSLQIAQNMQGRIHVFGICQEPMHIHVYAFALNAIRRTLNLCNCMAPEQKSFLIFMHGKTY